MQYPIRRVLTVSDYHSPSPSKATKSKGGSTTIGENQKSQSREYDGLVEFNANNRDFYNKKGVLR